MSTSLCPIATVDASVERVWSLLSDPAAYALWWDAHMREIVPPGPARVGQTVLADSRALGRRWDVRITVEAVDPQRHQLRLTSRLPLGITVLNSIACSPLDPASCRLSFG